MSTRAAIALLAAHALGCGGGSGDADAGEMDSFVPDAPMDAGSDVTDAADSAPDAAELDTGADASCMCPPPSECSTFECVGGACVEAPLIDGTTCGEMGICVGGACVLRGCGDGFRETGPEPPREACDDGNLDDGDACDSFCMPTLVQVAQSFLTEDDYWDPQLANGNHASVGVDDLGNVLVAYLQRGATLQRLMVQRYDRGGVALGDAVQLAADDAFNINVVGLSEGWAVAYTDMHLRVVFAVVPLDGTHTGRAVADRNTPGEIGLARIDDGFVVVWDDDELDGPRLYAWRFDETAVPMGTRIRVDVDSREDVHFPRAAGSGTEWAVVWEDRDIFPMIVSDLVVRRFDGDTAIDDMPLVVQPGGSFSNVAYLEDGIGVAYLTGPPANAYMRVVNDEGVSSPMVVSEDPDAEGGLFLGRNPGGVVLSYYGRAGDWVAIDIMGAERPELSLLLSELEGFDDWLSHATAPDGTTWFTWRGFGLDDGPTSGVYGALLYGLAP